MKKNTFIFWLLILLLPFYCQKENSTEPESNNGSHPQIDIPWPSLADSPWPIPYGNAQCTGRTNVVGPTQGEIAWIFTEDTMGKTYTSPVIGEDGTIYVSDDKRLYAVHPNGTLKWQFSKGPTNESCVLVASDDMIYYVTGDQYRSPSYSTYVYYLDKMKNLIWEFISEDMFLSYGVGLGLDGTLYFTDLGGYLVAVNNDGGLKWKTRGNGGLQSTWAISISFSPDGSTLYVPGADSTMNAFDTQTGDLVWQVNTNYGYFAKIAPLVDNAGNIYFFGNEDNRDYVCSVQKDGKVRWKYSDDEIYQLAFRCGMHMDYEGNLYFSNRKNVYSLTNDGKLNWKVPLPIPGSVSPILGDINNNIYIACSEESIVSYDQEGSQRFEVKIEGFGELINGALSGGCLYVGTSGKLICIK